jgi:peptide/nickel transport system substrate-binding protein
VWPEFARILVNGPSTSFHLIGAGPNSWDGQDTFTSIMMTRNAAAKQGGFNWALWTDADVDRIGNELKSTFDKGKRDKLYAEGFAIAKAKVHAVYLHQAMLTWGMKANIEAAVRADGTPMLQDITVR